MARQGFKEQIAVLGGIVPSSAVGQRARSLTQLVNAGPEMFADHEMLEMMLSSVLPRRRTKQIARALLEEFGTYPNALAASVPELLRIEGLGEVGAAALKLVHAAAMRLVRAEVRDQPVLSKWDKLMEYLNAALAREKVEQFRALFLDAGNRLLRDEILTRGTANQASVYPRQVLVRALELHAVGLILVHSHPSGDPTPSPGDVAMIHEIQCGAGILDILVHDHIFIGNGRWTSFRREGLLK